MKARKALAGTIVFIILFAIVYIVHSWFFKVNVVLYAAVGDVLIASFIAGCFLFRALFFKPLSSFEKVLLVTLWIMMGYTFAISGPAVIDRSLSIYILEKLQQRGGSLSLVEFGNVILKEYVEEHRLIDVRLTEQLVSGTIGIQDGHVYLTRRGQRIASFTRFFRTHFLPKHRLLRGVYTDELTDPFRKSMAPPVSDP